MSQGPLSYSKQLPFWHVQAEEALQFANRWMQALQILLLVPQVDRRQDLYLLPKESRTVPVVNTTLREASEEDLVRYVRVATVQPQNIDCTGRGVEFPIMGHVHDTLMYCHTALVCPVPHAMSCIPENVHYWIGLNAR